MYSPQRVVGDFFEKLVADLFELERQDPRSEGRRPDLYSLKYDFHVEVKASCFKTGGVIKGKQLEGFEDFHSRRFYAFPYHSIEIKMRDNYPSPEALVNALDLRSLFLFPISIIQAHFLCSTKRKRPDDMFVTLNEASAREIYLRSREAWRKLRLNQEDYEMAKIHEKVYLITRGDHLKQEIRDSFHPDFLPQ